MSRHAEAAPLVASRLQQQLSAIAAWNREAELLLRLTEQDASNREARMDAQRRMQALRRTRTALTARTEAVLEDTLRLLQEPRPRALLVHRSEWLRERVAARFAEIDVRVIAEVDDGADGLGIAIAEQPDIVLVEDRLPSLPAVEVVAALREFVTGAVVAVQVEHEEDEGPLIDAGADAVFSRRVPPAALADDIRNLLADARTGGALVG
jgi:CheY-like chemotaxis protein